MFAKRFLIGAQVVVVLLILACAAYAGDQNFPVGLWGLDANTWTDDWTQAGFSSWDLAQIRWHGIDIGSAGGVTVNNWPDWSDPTTRYISRNIQKKFVRYDSLGMRILLCPIRLHFSYPLHAGPSGTPRNYGMDVRGHDPLGLAPVKLD